MSSPCGAAAASGGMGSDGIDRRIQMAPRAQVVVSFFDVYCILTILYRMCYGFVGRDSTCLRLRPLFSLQFFSPLLSSLLFYPLLSVLFSSLLHSTPLHLLVSVSWLVVLYVQYCRGRGSRSAHSPPARRRPPPDFRHQRNGREGETTGLKQVHN